MLRFDDRVVIVTGAGSGLGRAHAIGFASRGAKVVVNDLSDNGEPSAASKTLVEELIAKGAHAISDPADVSDSRAVMQMIDRALSTWGRVDVLVNNAGILRDRTFSKMPLTDFDLVMKVHLGGAINCSKAVWDVMKKQKYGRILMTTSVSGLFGNFGQSNYGAAKAALVGLMNVLHLEGERYNIRVNAIAPSVLTAMTEALFDARESNLLLPEDVTPAVLYLTSETAPSRVIIGAGAGSFAVIHILESEGIFLTESERTPENIAERFQAMARLDHGIRYNAALDQTRRYVSRVVDAAS